MGWFSALFATEKAVDNIVDKDNGLLAQVGGWVGGFNYTAEEKAEADAQTREWGFRQLDALAPFKVVQRILAFAAAGLWIFVAINLVVAIWLKDVQVKNDLMAFAFSDYVFWPVCVVFALYFAGGVLPRKGNK
jgi:hypothetical protein